MKQLSIISAAKLLKLEDIKEFESQNGINFPLAFTNFLLRNNAIETEEVRFIANGIIRQACIFYPFDKDKNEMSFQWVFENLNEFFDNKYIAFAGDEGGWKFVLSVQESDFGKVYFCRMDEGLEDALTFLADSFEEFINGLERRPPEEKY